MARLFTQTTKHTGYKQKLVSIICNLLYNMTGTARSKGSNMDPCHVHLLLFISACCLLSSIFIPLLYSALEIPTWNPSKCLCRTVSVPLLNPSNCLCCLHLCGALGNLDDVSLAAPQPFIHVSE